MPGPRGLERRKWKPRWCPCLQQGKEIMKLTWCSRHTGKPSGMSRTHSQHTAGNPCILLNEDHMNHGTNRYALCSREFFEHTSSVKEDSGLWWLKFKSHHYSQYCDIRQSLGRRHDCSRVPWGPATGGWVLKPRLGLTKVHLWVLMSPTWYFSCDFERKQQLRGRWRGDMPFGPHQLAFCKPFLGIFSSVYSDLTVDSALLG